MSLIAFAVAGLYRSRLTFSLLDDIPALFTGIAVGFTARLSIPAVFDRVEPARSLIAHALVLLVCVSAFRSAAYFAVRLSRRQGRIQHQTVILGAGALGAHLARILIDHPKYGLAPVGFIDSNPSPRLRPLLPVPVLGPYEQLDSLIREHSVRDVIVAFGEKRESELVDLLRTCDRLHVQVFIVPRLYELHNVSRGTDDVRGIPLVRTREPAFRRPRWRTKRLFDLVVAASALLVLSPVLALCALAVRREGGPGVIFRQERVGLDGRPFDLLKFRSLSPVNEQESQTQWNIQNDHRLGPVGRFLRRTSLDELPQLWNIVKGDMSLVGPRPERPFFVAQFADRIPRYVARHRVPAGLTGWAQAHGLRGDTSIEERARFDNYYIENWSLWLDVKILVRTVGQVLRREGG
ncbi:sugar transferase [Nocardioides mesophilus]|uniref:sugar transferase n=1 Tax=Nocardioides mesophilus TaxID=433659 RepID=UPI001CB6BA7E|nr:sugar transferase [Nocardioides mesophilus]